MISPDGGSPDPAVAMERREEPRDGATNPVRGHSSAAGLRGVHPLSPVSIQFLISKRL